MGTDTAFLLTSAETGGAFTLYRVTAVPGSIVPTHTHAHEDETFMVHAGQLQIIVQGEVIMASPGDVVFGPRGIPHSWESVGEVPAVFDVMTTPSAMETMFRELSVLGPGDGMEAVLEVCARAGIHFAPIAQS
ncbi:cupin domain-containing protein [Coraliomargarita parva]|uniref:cupin domain-containing protein n=1 Tax=Coraliomargarita parva TaxID=3014050 RepID=UPI0022B3DF39|nr:cupin domain-containing protein [Coraliomargarita parva]